MSSVKIVISCVVLFSIAGCKQTCFDDLHVGNAYSTSLAGRYDAEMWMPFWELSKQDVPECGGLVNPGGFSFKIVGNTNDPACDLPFGGVVQPPVPSSITIADPAIRTKYGTLIAFPTYHLTIGSCSGIWSPWLHDGAAGDFLKPIEPGKQPAVVYHSLFAPTDASLAACVMAGFPAGTAFCEDRFAVELRPALTK